MSKIPVYICNHKRCMVCYRTLCGRTVDKEFAELDENGDPIIAEYYDDEEVNLEEVAKRLTGKRLPGQKDQDVRCELY